MVNDQPAAAFDVSFEQLLDTLRPLDSFVRMAAVEIIDDGLILREVRIPLLECFRSNCGDIDTEAARFVQNRPDTGGSGGPIVVVDAIDNQNADLRVGERGHPK